ncbi:MAG: hypothetical protein H0X25_14885 [Acidobacteriales bacterium]|nr:hypothetical protein [Terriglobales bacterium]
MAQVKKSGRPPASTGAKSKDPDFMPTTVYINRNLYADTRAALIRAQSDFSALVNSLLIDWIKTQKR